LTPISTPRHDPAVNVRELSGDEDRAAWNGFVASLPEGDVLQAWEWGAVKAEWTPVRIAAFRDAKIVGGAALLMRALPMVGRFYYAPRGPLLSDWTDESVLAAILKAISQRAAADGAAFLKIDPAVPIERDDVAALLAGHGFRPPATTDAQGFGGTQPRCVMQLDLAGRSEQELLSSFKPQTRRNIKLSAEKHGVEVVADAGREALAEFDRLMRITGERDGFRPRGRSYFEALWDNLVTAGLAKLFLTTFQGEYLSGAICFVIGDKSWYVYGASSNEHRNAMPNYAMQWAMIRWALAQGCRWYDFRGVSPRRRVDGESAEEVEKEDHLQGLNRFKEGFGTRYVEYIGELDLVYRPAAYWMFTYGKPAAQKIARKLRPGSH
jgi:peptidoglycan pentaglycine glycine transferase (the first glycine)